MKKSQFKKRQRKKSKKKSAHSQCECVSCREFERLGFEEIEKGVFVAPRSRRYDKKYGG